jgi:hypothetical protein
MRTVEANVDDTSGREAPKRHDPFGWEGRELLPDVSSDETDSGWGEDRAGTDPADLRRFLDDKPPHHI